MVLGGYHPAYDALLCQAIESAPAGWVDGVFWVPLSSRR